MTPKTYNDVIVGNVYDKYHAKNPIVQWLMKGFFMEFDALLSLVPAKRMLEVGAGEGHLTKRIYKAYPKRELVALELSPDLVAQAQKEMPHISFLTGSIYEMPFSDAEFDLIIASEVLEHLDDPARALQEIHRVTRQFAILSVPDEPLWRLLNLVRFKYLAHLGNTPGHIQHWGMQSFAALVSGRFQIVKIKKRLPWIFVLAQKS